MESALPPPPRVCLLRLAPAEVARAAEMRKNANRGKNEALEVLSGERDGGDISSDDEEDELGAMVKIKGGMTAEGEEAMREAKEKMDEQRKKRDALKKRRKKRPKKPVARKRWRARRKKPPSKQAHRSPPRGLKMHAVPSPKNSARKPKNRHPNGAAMNAVAGQAS